MLSSFVWDKEGKVHFTKLLNSEATRERFKQIIVNEYTDVNVLLMDFKSIILDVAVNTLSSKVGKRGNKYIKKPLELELGPHFNTLKKGKKCFTSARRLYNKDKQNRYRRHEMIVARRQYKKIKYMVFRYNKIDKL